MFVFAHRETAGSQCVSFLLFLLIGKRQARSEAVIFSELPLILPSDHDMIPRID